MTNEQVAEKIDSLKELVEAKLEPLAKREDVLAAIASHSKDCPNKSIFASGDLKKVIAGVVGSLTVLSGAVYGLIEAIQAISR